MTTAEEKRRLLASDCGAFGVGSHGRVAVRERRRSRTVQKLTGTARTVPPPVPPSALKKRY
jgi:hypothetical protein